MLLIICLVAVFISVGTLGGYWIYREYSDFKLQSYSLKQRLLTERKQQIKAEVEKAAGFIEFTKERMYKRLRRELRDKVHLAHGVAQSIYLEQKDTIPLEKIMSQVKRVLSRIRFWDDECYYFAADLKGRGERLLSPDKIAQGDISQRFDLEIPLCVKQMAESAKREEQGFLQYDLAEPVSAKHPRTKLSFVKKFAPFDWYIGTGEYLDQATRRIQAEVIKGLEKVIFPPGGYLFVGDFKGNALMGRFAKQNSWSFKSLANKNVVQDLMHAARNGGGFVHYTMILEKDPDHPRQKISYTMPIKDWDWFVGAGFFKDEIDLKLAHRQERLRKQITAKISNILVFMFLASLLTYVFWMVISNWLAKEMAVFKDFFAQAATKSEPMELEKLKSREFKNLAGLANQMLEQRKRAEEEKAQMERQLSQAKKMEAIGTLAGGIAHDFNNILGAIMGYAELAQNKLFKTGCAGVEIQKILDAAERAGSLVRRILTFSRRHNTQYEPLNLNQVIRRAMELLSRTLPKMMEIKLFLGKDLPFVLGDANELEQVIMNLASNAKDAMPQGGRLCITTSLVYLPSKLPAPVDKKMKTPFVQLKVSDTGCGIAREHLEQIYDPFFTTKGIGKGTGLGLSTVIGIVKNHNGWIECASAPEKGAIFTIYFPLALAAQKKVSHKSLENPVQTGPLKKGFILVVDDEKALRETTSKLLTLEGHRVVTATNGEDALKAYEQSQTPFDLVILDVSMPGMGGTRCLDELKSRDPNLKVIMMSGYPLQGSLAQLKKNADGYLAKPVRAIQIIKAVQKAL
jgi:signal transduction histidine kinase/CheY-like chemotaxis protein